MFPLMNVTVKLIEIKPLLDILYKTPALDSCQWTKEVDPGINFIVMDWPHILNLCCL